MYVLVKFCDITLSTFQDTVCILSTYMAYTSLEINIHSTGIASIQSCTNNSYNLWF